VNQNGPNPWGQSQGSQSGQFQQGLGGSFDGIDQEFMLWKTSGQSLPQMWQESSGERAAFKAGYLLAYRKKI
jgi:hypothetical protein